MINYNLTLVKMNDLESAITGGGYAVVNADITINRSLPIEKQLSLLFHEYLELAFGDSISHDELDDLQEGFEDLVIKLQELNASA